MLMMFGGAVIGMITGLLGYTVIVDGVFSVVNFLILTGGCLSVVYASYPN